MTDASAEAAPAPFRARWGLALALGSALAWGALARVPLVVNAASHLDSDLAVDGLTLLDFRNGLWRWHYPGTPHIGTPTVLLSLPQAMAWGVGPSTLVSGGVVAYLLLMLATFDLARVVLGPRVALGSLVPLAFGSTGMLWLSGRVTGGHLAAALWHAGAFAIAARHLKRPSIGRAAVVGVWCGFGLYLDSMFATSLVGLSVVLLVGWRAAWPARGAMLACAALVAGFAVGLAPRWIGARVDPYSAYEDQFRLVRDPELIRGHAALLVEECLPRLFWGRKLPGLESDPDPRALGGAGPVSGPSVGAVGPLAVMVAGLGIPLAVGAFLAVVVAVARTRDRVARAIALGLLASAAAVLAGFVLNRNIFNSDNYRYLVGLLVPWALGWGILLDALSRRGAGGLTAAVALSALWAAALTLDTAAWYARFGWIDGRGRPVRAERAEPLLDWLDEHPEVAWIEGGYWDVYRLVFLTGGRVRGVPFPVYPNRFPEWSPPARGARTRVLIARRSPEAQAFVERAMEAGGKVEGRVGGATLIVQP